MDKKRKEAVTEVPVQERASIKVNELRIKNGLEPIKGRDQNFIPEEIFNKFSKALDETAKEFINELKNNCKTYSDINEKLRLFEKEINYNCREIYINIAFISHVKDLLEKEKNDLPLTSHSK